MSVSTLIFTLDEEIHLPACLQALQWCDDVVVVDSYSSDRTEEICREQGVRFVQHVFEGFGKQRNWALTELDLKHDWVLILDADERVPPALAQELLQVCANAQADYGAFKLRRRFHMWGRWLRYSSLYPTWVVRVVHKAKTCYENRGHAETQHVDGRIGTLTHDLIDENLKGLDEWLERQSRYARKEAAYELRQERKLGTDHGAGSTALNLRASVKHWARILPFRGLWYFCYAYFLRGGFLEGRDGLAFCRLRAMYYNMVELKKYDHKRNQRH